MYHRPQQRYVRRSSMLLIMLFSMLIASCGGSKSTVNGGVTPAPGSIITFPNVGTTDLTSLDPAQQPDQNSAIVVNMLYSGLVRTDKNLHIIPDQASWQVSADSKTYTFILKPDLSFSDGTPVSAQSYVYTWTRALLPAVNSPFASSLEAPIVGAAAVSNGNTQTLEGVRALNEHTLQVTLTKPTPYFLAALTNALFFPLNQQIIQEYGQQDWERHVAEQGVGTGPWMVASWLHNVKMILLPNPHYYGNKLHISQINMLFVEDPTVAFKAYRAGQYDFMWGLDPSDSPAAKSSAFTSAVLLQTDALFFDITQPPFDTLAVRQAFVAATDKASLVHTVFNDTALPAASIFPPGMPGYQSQDVGRTFDANKASVLIHSVYPDVTIMPTVTFSYPSSEVSASEATSLQQMWQKALGIQIILRAVEDNAYSQELQNHQIPFGFTSWNADFPDPYDCLALYFSSTSRLDSVPWHNADFEQLLVQAESTTENARLAFYDQAEQLALTQVGVIPLDHQNITAIIPAWLHGVALNGNGLYFGDWSTVYSTRH